MGKILGSAPEAIADCGKVTEFCGKKRTRAINLQLMQEKGSFLARLHGGSLKILVPG
ncbi:hypothetical protein [Roseofilum capinflatum]|uniref:Uncharacterized protein n=1 Tax=Roseofilum capinflatum BLCC-M114 TaxID=3022440 RepID=A0ABT7B4M0_9CYAN|nr:hypothetical protein [Roseofilum capinflatum]MDJ1173752.1 hypothetical protein [Roseofilum capinflatum BLCC-M114]